MLGHNECMVHSISEVRLLLQDDDYLYLVMEYLAGGDVMVSLASTQLDASIS